MLNGQREALLQGHTLDTGHTGHGYNVQCAMFSVERSMFNVECTMANGQ